MGKIIKICFAGLLLCMSSTQAIRLHDDDVWADMVDGTNASEFIQDAPKDYTEPKKVKPKIDYKLV